jgi:hypothetical protein
MRHRGTACRQLSGQLRPPLRIIYMMRATSTGDLAVQLGREGLAQARQGRVAVDLDGTPQAARERATLNR